MLAIIAVWISKVKIGTAKVRAMINFAKNVEAVDDHICDLSFVFDSVARCIPVASESASAIAITKIPPMIANLEFVEEYKPMIKPKVVITPDVNPKLNPDFIDDFILSISPISFLIVKIFFYFF